MLINADERLDDLQYKGLCIIQNPKYFCFGTDSVLLASFTSIKRTDRVIDLGCGTGILSILINGRTGASVTGIDIQPALVDMAARSAMYNCQEGIKALVMDMRDAPNALGHGSFDAVVCNPPYFNGSLTGVNESRTVSMHNSCCRIQDVALSAKRLLKHGGRLFMSYPSSGVFELSHALSGQGIEIKRYRLVSSYLRKPPYLVLIEAKKGAKSGVVCERPLIIHDNQGRYTDEAKSMYHMD